MKSLFKAKIYHKRFLPKINEFLYSGYYIKFSLSELNSLNSTLFSVNKFNLFSFYEKDHGNRDGTSLSLWVNKILTQAGIDNFQGEIILQTFPRVMGYVFNPVSFWYCYENKLLKAIICEVNNTFGESHNYVLKNSPDSAVNSLSKHFHVSPFYDRIGFYLFDFRIKDRIKINYYFDDQLQLETKLTGEEISLSDKNLLKLFFKHPFYTFTIVFLIHVQAFFLYQKKIKFYTKPEKKEIEVTYE